MSHFTVLYAAALRWYDRDASLHAAALAYYTPFALTPLIFVSVSVLGIFYGADYAADILRLWGGMLGADIVNLLALASDNLREATPGPGLSIIGGVFFFSMVVIAFNAVTSGFHHLWEVPHSGLQGWLRKCWRSLVFVVVLQAYLILMMAVDWFFMDAYRGFVPYVSVGISFLATTLLFYLMYSFLTLRSFSRQGTLAGAIVASLLLILTRNLVGLYVGTAAVPKLYDAAGLIIALLIWIYAAAAIIYYGACVVYEYDRLKDLQ